MMTLVAATLAMSGQQMGGPELAELARRAAMAALEHFKQQKLTEDQLGITVGLIDRGRKQFTSGSFRGDVAMYPASVVKMFFMAHAAELLHRRQITLTKELERGIRDMIVDSSNDATALVLDTITGTTGGPELPERELKVWMDKRNAVNKWFKARGYTNINVNQKTWNEGPYGRERQGYGPNFELRNSLTPDACARLMSEIALGSIVSPEKCEWMKGYLHRRIVADGGEQPDYQSRAFLGKVVPKGSKHYSKAGYTSTVRHDVAYVVTPDGRELVLAVFTKGQSNTESLIPFLGEQLLKGLGVLPASESS